jgi:AFG3 family protein
MSFSNMLYSLSQFLLFTFLISIAYLIFSSNMKKQDNNEIDSIFSRGMDYIECKNNIDVKFKDVAGMDEIVNKVQTYVDIIKNREKYIEMGANIPKGVILYGPPGCGKTLLAKAVAGESGVSFISTTAVDFDEVYVGVGSARVKKIFSLARENAPSIIYIDEIDCFGKKNRSKYSGNGSDAMFKILSEMDGFKNNENIMVFASTNNIGNLDSALMRSGRFDAKFFIDLPKLEERTEIFKLHLGKIKMNVEKNDLVRTLSKMTPGVSGADIKNICNLAAINATASGNEYVMVNDIYRSIDDVMIGFEKKKTGIKKELDIVSYHESGHALVGLLIRQTESPVKLSIIPRGDGNLGYTQPHNYEKNLSTKGELLGKLCSLFGGRETEKIIFGEATNGCMNDMEMATKIVTNMICNYGMIDNYSVHHTDRRKCNYLSEENRKEVEDMTERILLIMSIITRNILLKYEGEIKQLSENLKKNEIIEYAEIIEMFPSLEDSIDVWNLISIYEKETNDEREKEMCTILIKNN